MKRKLSVLLAVLLILCSFAATGAFADPAKETIIPEPVYRVDDNGGLAAAAVVADAAICIDADTGAVLYEKSSTEKMYPASITKVMTCLLALEYVEHSGKGMEEIVTVEQPYKLEDGAVEIYLRAGETFTMEQLLHALMLKSANDVAILLAEHIGGSVEGFADMMNARAQEIGMTHSHFVNPHGLHNEDHYITASDMALLMQEAIKNENFCSLLGTMRYTIPATNKTGEERNLSNSNRLLKESESSYYEYCLGGKTGYTSKARNTFVCFGSKSGRTVVAVVLHSPLSNTRFLSAKNLLRYGLDNFENINLAELLPTGQLTARISGSQEMPNSLLELPAEQVPQGDVLVTGRNGKLTADDYDARVEWNENLTAPIAAGDKLGTVSYYYKTSSEPSLVCDLMASRDVLSAKPEENTNISTYTQAGQPAQTTAKTPVTPKEDHSITAWLTAALIILIALIVVVALMLFHAGGNRHKGNAYTTQPTNRRNSNYGRSSSHQRSSASGRRTSGYSTDRRTTPTNTGRRGNSRDNGRHGRLR